MFLVLTGVIYDSDGDLSVGVHWEDHMDAMWFRRAIDAESLRSQVVLQFSGSWSEMDYGEGW